MTDLQVIKVGGSLFDFPPLADRLRQLIALDADRSTVLIAGGGRLVDELQRLQGRQQLPDQPLHWLCVRLLSVMAHTLGALLPEAPVLDDPDRLRRPARPRRRGDRRAASAGPWIFDPARWLLEHPDYASGWLPASWDVTSDSIAARLAERLGATCLLLAKSADPPAASRREAAVAGYVDAFFPTAAARLARVHCVNLRHSTLRRWELAASPELPEPPGLSKPPEPPPG